MPISSHCFWPCESSPAGRSRVRRCRWISASVARDAVELRARRDAQSSDARTRLSAFIASSRFSNTDVLLEHRRLLELAADAGVRDLGLAQARQVDGLAEERGAGVGPRLAGDHVHHRRLAGAVGADDAAQLAGLDRQASACSAP